MLAFSFPCNEEIGGEIAECSRKITDRVHVKYDVTRY